MARNAVASDFESRLRPLYHAAKTQGWTMELTGQGHVKWFPPGNGVQVTSSTYESHYDKILKDLQRSGLEYPPVIERAERPTRVEVKGSYTEETKESVETKINRQFKMGEVSTAVRQVMTTKIGVTVDIDSVFMEVQQTLPGVEKGSVNQALRAQAKQGLLLKPARGLYRMPSSGENPPLEGEVEAELPVTNKEPVTTLDGDDLLDEERRVISKFMEALADLERLFAARRTTMKKFVRIMELLKGVEK